MKSSKRWQKQSNKNGKYVVQKLNDKGEIRFIFTKIIMHSCAFHFILNIYITEQIILQESTFSCTFLYNIPFNKLPLKLVKSKK